MPTLQLKKNPRVFLAGQLTGTEGYLESSATGLLAGVNAARLALGEAPLTLPADTMLGALLAAVTDESREHFQPMNSNMGILPPLANAAEVRRDKKARNAAHAERSRLSLGSWKLSQSDAFAGETSEVPRRAAEIAKKLPAETMN